MAITIQNLVTVGQTVLEIRFFVKGLLVESQFGPILIGDLDLCHMTLTFIYDLDINNGYHHTKNGDCRSNGSGDTIFCQVTFGPV